MIQTFECVDGTHISIIWPTGNPHDQETVLIPRLSGSMWIGNFMDVE